MELGFSWQGFVVQAFNWSVTGLFMGFFWVIGNAAAVRFLSRWASRPSAPQRHSDFDRDSDHG